MSEKKDAMLLTYGLQLKKRTLIPHKTMAVFSKYMANGSKTITKKLFINNLVLKLQDHTFLDDIEPLLAPRLKNTHSRPLGINTLRNEPFMTLVWSLVEAVEVVKSTLIEQLII